MWTIYKHTSPSNKVYIGITSKPVERRWGKGIGYKTNDHFWKAIEKYGWDNFKHEIIAVVETKEEACEQERRLIDQFDSSNPQHGYNNSKGGEYAGYGVTCTDEKRQKIRESRLGDKHWFYGKHLSEEHRRKISEGNKGKRLSDETKLKQKEMATKLRGKPILCIETGLVFPSISEASRTVGVNRAAIIAVLNGKHKTAAKYHWTHA